MSGVIVRCETEGLIRKHYLHQSILMMLVAVDHIHVYSVDIYPRLNGTQCQHNMAKPRSNTPIALSMGLRSVLATAVSISAVQQLPFLPFFFFFTFLRHFSQKYTLTKPHAASDWSPQPRSGHAGFDSTEWDKKTICEALEILQLLQLLPFTAPVLAILSLRSK